MSDTFVNLFVIGVVLSLVLIFVGIPYIESFLPEDLIAGDGEFKQFEPAKADSGSPVPTATVVELASVKERPDIPEALPEQEELIPLAA